MSAVTESVEQGQRGGPDLDTIEVTSAVYPMEPVKDKKKKWWSFVFCLFPCFSIYRKQRNSLKNHTVSADSGTYRTISVRTHPTSAQESVDGGAYDLVVRNDGARHVHFAETTTVLCTPEKEKDENPFVVEKPATPSTDLTVPPSSSHFDSPFYIPHHLQFTPDSGTRDSGKKLGDGSLASFIMCRTLDMPTALRRALEDPGTSAEERDGPDSGHQSPEDKESTDDSGLESPDDHVVAKSSLGHSSVNLEERLELAMKNTENLISDNEACECRGHCDSEFQLKTPGKPRTCQHCMGKVAGIMDCREAFQRRRELSRTVVKGPHVH